MSAPRPIEADALSDQLCLACGLCCDGTLFKDVELQPGDDPTHLARFSEARRTRSGAMRFPQPCAALDGCSCRIYRDRPSRCRQFQCLLFMAVSRGETSVPGALGVIRRARRQAARVRRLLQELGDRNETQPLSARFRRVKASLEKRRPDEATRHRFGELTRAMHELNLLLGESFL